MSRRKLSQRNLSKAFVKYIRGFRPVRKLKTPLTYNPKTWEVWDADRKLIAFIGPESMRAIQKMVKEKSL